jgi:hypothetical protein
VQAASEPRGERQMLLPAAELASYGRLVQLQTHLKRAIVLLPWYHLRDISVSVSEIWIG